jgi:predicted MFS family arabinose efflux permease
VAAFAAAFSALALIIYLTTWLQSVLGYSPVGTGARMLVFTGATMLSAPLAGKLTESVTPQITMPLSLLLIAGGGLSMTAVTAASSWTAIIPGLFLTGFGVGLITPTLDFASVEVVPPWRSGMASGINSTCREGGTAAGVAVLGSVLAHEIGVHVHAGLAGTASAAHAPAIASAISAGATPQLLAQSPAAMRPVLLHLAHTSFAAGLRGIFLLAAVVAMVGCISSLALVRRRHLRVGQAE